MIARIILALLLMCSSAWAGNVAMLGGGVAVVSGCNTGDVLAGSETAYSTYDIMNNPNQVIYNGKTYTPTKSCALNKGKIYYKTAWADTNCKMLVYNSSSSSGTFSLVATSSIKTINTGWVEFSFDGSHTIDISKYYEIK